MKLWEALVVFAVISVFWLPVQAIVSFDLSGQGWRHFYLTESLCLTFNAALVAGMYIGSRPFRRAK